MVDDRGARAAQEVQDAVNLIEFRDQREWELHVASSEALTAVEVARAGRMRAISALVSVFGMGALAFAVVGVVWVVRHW